LWRIYLKHFNRKWQMRPLENYSFYYNTVTAYAVKSAAISIKKFAPKVNKFNLTYCYSVLYQF